MASPSLADTVVARIADAYRTHRDPARAPGMEAYMRGQFPFLGLPTPERRRLARDALVGLPRPSDADLVAVARRCWALPEREFQYFACDYLRTHAKRASAAVLADVAELIVTKSWWDTVDGLATQTAGTLVAQHRELVETMDAWISADNMWLARTAILHQLRFRDATDVDRLFRYCLARAGDDEFFIRKAIGWALREYSKTDGERVRRFVAARAGELSPLSRREAMAWLDRRTLPMTSARDERRTDMTTAITITGVTAIGIPVTDQDRALDFYCGTLGLEKRLDVPTPGGGRWVTVGPSGGGGPSLALVVAYDGVPPGVETGIRLTTPDAESAHRALEAGGVDVGELLRWPGVPAMFAFRDHDGNGLELVEVAP